MGKKRGGKSSGNFNNNNYIEQNKREKLLGIVENKPPAQ